MGVCQQQPGVCGHVCACDVKASHSPSPFPHAQHHQVFCVTGSKAHDEMRTACFDYLALGGKCASGPVSLLSGLNPSPSALVMHFFSVALFGVQRLVKPRPTFR